MITFTISRKRVIFLIALFAFANSLKPAMTLSDYRLGAAVVVLFTIGAAAWGWVLTEIALRTSESAKNPPQ